MCDLQKKYILYQLFMLCQDGVQRYPKKVPSKEAKEPCRAWYGKFHFFHGMSAYGTYFDRVYSDKLVYKILGL